MTAVQVFALDSVLTVLPGADRDTVLKAMHDRAVACGELAGTFQRAK